MPPIGMMDPTATKRIDNKHEIRISPDGEIKIVKFTNGQPIPDDEPVILFRARDYLAVPMLEFYCDLCKNDGATEYQLASMDDIIQKFKQFARDNPGTMKQPGVTLGK